MAHNPAWVVNKHPNNLKAQIKELVEHGYTVTLQDSSSAQLVRKKSFSCLFALITGVIPYALYYMAKNDYTVYLDLDNQHPDPDGTKKEPSQMMLLLKVCGIIFIALISVGAIVGFIEGVNEQDGTSETTEAVAPIIDAPHILSLTIEEARKELGTPTDGEQTEPTALQVSIGTTTWDNSFKVNGYDIVLDYDVKSRQVTSFFIATNDPSGATRNWKSLAKLAGMNENATAYSVKPVQAINKSGYYTGVTAADK